MLRCAVSTQGTLATGHAGRTAGSTHHGAAAAPHLGGQRRRELSHHTQGAQCHLAPGDTSILPQAWERFTTALSTTSVAYLYVSEHHLEGTGLKILMRDAIRENRKYVVNIHTRCMYTTSVPPHRMAPPRDVDVLRCINNMWFNPKLPGTWASCACADTHAACRGYVSQPGLGHAGDAESTMLFGRVEERRSKASFCPRFVVVVSHCCPTHPLP